MQSKKQAFTLHQMVMVGVMAAVCFATCYISFKIPTPTGTTMLKIGGAFCLSAGMILGGLKGGLAAGIGCMFFDLLDPVFISAAPFTFAFYFIMAFVCGTISNLGKDKPNEFIFNLIGAFSGALTYFILHISKSIIVLMISGSQFIPAVISTAPKMLTSTINGVLGVVIAVLIVPGIKKALKKSKIYV